MNETGGLVKKRHPFPAIRFSWRASIVALIPWTALAILGTPPAFAAERTVLCEEFTNKW